MGTAPHTPSLTRPDFRIVGALVKKRARVHPDHKLPVADTLALMDQVALDFPELTIVGGHIGYPWTDEAIAVATKHPNVYIDTSAYTTKRYPAQLVEYMRAHGRSKVLFGTNYPMIAPAQALKHIDELELDEEAKALFLSGNAQRVFKL